MELGWRCELVQGTGSRVSLWKREKQRRMVLSLARSKSLAWKARRLFAKLQQLLLIPEHVDELVTGVRPHLFHLCSSLNFNILFISHTCSTSKYSVYSAQHPSPSVSRSSSYVVLLSPLCPPSTRLAAVNRYASNHQHQPNRFPPLHLRREPWVTKMANQ
jgi:hypothetical protein